MNKKIDLKIKKAKFTDVTSLGKRIISFADKPMNNHQVECYQALIYNYNKGNYHKAKDIADMLDGSLNNQDIQKDIMRDFKVVK